MPNSIEVHKYLSLAKIEAEHLQTLLQQLVTDYSQCRNDSHKYEIDNIVTIAETANQISEELNGLIENYEALGREFLRRHEEDRLKKIYSDCAILREKMTNLSNNLNNKLTDTLKGVQSEKIKLVRISLSEVITFKDNVRSLYETGQIERYVDLERDTKDVQKLHAQLGEDFKYLNSLTLDFNDKYDSLQIKFSNRARGLGKEGETDRKKIETLLSEYQSELATFRQTIFGICKKVAMNTNFDQIGWRYTKVQKFVENSNPIMRIPEPIVRMQGKEQTRCADLSTKDYQKLRETKEGYFVKSFGK